MLTRSRVEQDTVKLEMGELVLRPKLSLLADVKDVAVSAIKAEHMSLPSSPSRKRKASMMEHDLVTTGQDAVEAQNVVLNSVFGVGREVTPLSKHVRQSASPRSDTEHRTVMRTIDRTSNAKVLDHVTTPPPIPHLSVHMSQETVLEPNSLRAKSSTLESIAIGNLATMPNSHSTCLRIDSKHAGWQKDQSDKDSTSSVGRAALKCDITNVDLDTGARPGTGGAHTDPQELDALQKIPDYRKSWRIRGSIGARPVGSKAKFVERVMERESRVPTRWKGWPASFFPQDTLQWSTTE